MNKAFLFILIAASGNAIYHAGQKSLPSSVNPLTLVTSVFALSFGGMLVASLILSPSPFLTSAKQLISWPILAISLGGLLIEFSVLFAYRHGSSVQWTGPAINGLAPLILIPASLIIFRENLSLSKLAGVALTISGPFLLARK